MNSNTDNTSFLWVVCGKTTAASIRTGISTCVMEEVAPSVEIRADTKVWNQFCVDWNHCFLTEMSHFYCALPDAHGLCFFQMKGNKASYCSEQIESDRQHVHWKHIRTSSDFQSKIRTDQNNQLKAAVRKNQSRLIKRPLWTNYWIFYLESLFRQMKGVFLSYDDYLCIWHQPNGCFWH